MLDADSLRTTLRGIRVLGADLPHFDTDTAPDEPLPLLRDWLYEAIDAGVAQPHAIALATASVTGGPSNRTLLVKDIDDEALWFASVSSGPKGRDLTENPRASALFYWREQARQVRLTGRVEHGPRSVSEADFLQRREAARLAVVAGDQSTPITNAQERFAAARAILDLNPDFVPADWVAYRLIPETVEFWQAERERDQVRLRYSATSTGWARDILWP